MKATIGSLPDGPFGNDVSFTFKPVVITMYPHIIPEATMPSKPLHDGLSLSHVEVLNRLRHVVGSSHLCISHMSVAVEFTTELLHNGTHLHNAINGVPEGLDIWK